MFNFALDYKLKWEQELERRKDLGITGPAPLPHPDDVHLNLRTSGVIIIGPLIKQQKAEWDRLHDLLEQCDREVQAMTAQMKKTRSKNYRASLEQKSQSFGTRGDFSSKGSPNRAREEDDVANIEGDIPIAKPNASTLN